MFPFTALDVSPRDQYDVSEVSAQDVVGIHLLREHDSIQSGQDLLRDELNIFWCDSYTTLKLSKRQATIHRIRRSRSDIPTA